jgi:hypothetical protein
MPAAYPVNDYQPILPFDGEPDEARGMLGQVGVDCATGKFYQKIGKWFPFGEGPGVSELTTLSGNASVDGAMADGVASNNVTFTATDQNGQPMAANLTLTVDKETAILNATTITTNESTGSGTVSLTDTVVEAVTVTATADEGGKTATATANFVEITVQKA